MDNQIISLSIDLCERLGILAVVFFLMMRFAFFRRLLTGNASFREKLFHAVFFGLAGIFATYCGFPVEGAIANLRGVPIAISGILGGPLVGLAAGCIAGVHRYLIDVNGLTSLACALATLLEGVVAGLIYQHLQRRKLDWLVAFFCGVVIESIKMCLILMLSRPMDAAVSVVYSIALPTILSNAFGIAVMVELIASVAREQERAMTRQAQTILQIAFKTLPHLRQGLSQKSATETARIIKELSGLDAVSLYSDREILGHAGFEQTQHPLSGHPLSTSIQQAFEAGTVVFARTKQDIGCLNPGCGLGSAIVVPLKKWDKTVGVLGLYRRKEHGISGLDEELANGLAHLFSNQLELGEIEYQRKLVSEAEIKALQAQINPHFLFNAISSIINYTRTDPGMASSLLAKLADFFRRNISPVASKVSLSVELEHCESYIAIEKARYEERLCVIYDIDDEALICQVPSLVIQPLVENGVRHGIMCRSGGGTIHIAARKYDTGVCISVRDNGVGMSQERISMLLSDASPLKSDTGLGIALRNVNDRLKALYGRENALHIESEPGKGTTVYFSVPVYQA